MSKYAHLAKPNEEWAAAYAQIPHPDNEAMDKLSMPERRAVVSGFMTAARKANPLVLNSDEVRKVEYKIPVGDGVEIRAASYTPVPKAEKGEDEGTLYPLLVYYHGGGFAMLDIEMDEGNLSNLAIASRVSAITIDYRLAPEHPFPVGLNDSYAALKWAITNAKEKLKADVSKGLYVGGASSGGNFAAALSIMARDDPTFPAKINGQLLQIPVVVHRDAHGKYADEILSHEEQKDEPHLNATTIKKILESYLPDPSTDITDPRISPLLLASHKGLPPAFIQICGMDPLRDEAFVYERVLKEASVPVKVAVYPGVPHGFQLGTPHIAMTKRWNADVEDAMAWFAAQAA